MQSGTLTALRLAEGLGDALVEIHREDGDAVSQSDTIKRQVAACYDYYAAYGADVIWNWGMFDESIHRDLVARLGAFDQYESDGYSEQLYCYTFNPVLSGEGAPKKVLEVGCGFGRGLNFLSRLNAGSVFVGLDLAEEAVRRANARFSRPHLLTYVQGDAEQLPFGDGEFDAVINVESSHHYPNLRGFLLEVARVLRPGGIFSHVDVFTDRRYAEMQQCKLATSSALTWLEEHDISERVRESVRRRMVPGSTFRAHLDRWLPWYARLALRKHGMRAFGSTFVVPERVSDAMTPGTRAARWRLPALMTSYRHSLATKPRP
jgi:SAM-dependent methyltransferase